MTLAPFVILTVLSLHAAPVAQEPATPSAEGPIGSPTVALLKERFVGATTDNERNKLLDLIAQATPASAQDISALFDLFSRYSDPSLRQKIMDSLSRLRPGAPQLEPLMVTYLQQVEPESQLFGINGAFRLRSSQALPLIWKIAEKKFTAPSAASINALSERNIWWTQYEALSVLAQWEGDNSLKLLHKKAAESPAVARLLGQFFWLKTFPELKRWAVSKSNHDRAIAIEVSGAPIEQEQARTTREDMLAILKNAATDEEVRHRLALKIGACSTNEETEMLVILHDQASNDRDRLLWAAAIFASHQPASVPILARYARQSPDPLTRAGARTLLVDQIGEEATVKLLNEEISVKK